MTYKREKGQSIVGMCIYIDNNIYTSNYDEELVYKYLYFICLHQARKNRYFKSPDLYDSFALFCASRLLLRLKNPKQFEFDENNEPRMKKISGILNYINSTIYCMKVDFEKDEYYQGISEPSTRQEQNYNFENIIDRARTHTKFSDWELMMGDISKTARKFLSTIPYKQDSIEWFNIYTSVMLTFLQSITIENVYRRLLTDTGESKCVDEIRLYSHIKNQMSKPPILFHLSQDFSDYITVLSRQLRSIIARDLSDILHTKVYSDFMTVQYEVDRFCKEEFDLYESKE